jgi:ferric-dicitrate binding protein FerR (iron transport regulator)
LQQQVNNQPMEQEKIIYYANLISKQINHGLTPDEQLELNAWLEANPSNQMVYDGLREGDAQQSAIDFMNSLSVDAAWKKVSGASKISRSVPVVKSLSSFRKRFAWAAAAAAVLAASFFIWRTNMDQPVQSSAAPVEISPGGNKATLTLADGKIISLDAIPNGDIAAEGDVQVIKMDGTLQYNGANDNAEITYNTIQTPRGGKYQLVLSDGTLVWLNAASSLRFPVTFSNKERLVELKGEAYFEVKKGERPFRVSLQNSSQIEVKGTAFNVNAYYDEEMMKATLIEGKINFVNLGKTQALVPGQQIRLTYEQPEKQVVEDVDVEKEIAWKNDLFIFKGMDVRSIMREISRWYDIDVVYKGKISPETFSGIVSRKSNLSQVLKIMEEGGVRFEIEGRTIVVF